jgi:hypothetical protein
MALAWLRSTGNASFHAYASITVVNTSRMQARPFLFVCCESQLKLSLGSLSRRCRALHHPPNLVTCPLELLLELVDVTVGGSDDPAEVIVSDGVGQTVTVGDDLAVTVKGSDATRVRTPAPLRKSRNALTPIRRGSCC